MPSRTAASSSAAKGEPARSGTVPDARRARRSTSASGDSMRARRNSSFSPRRMVRKRWDGIVFTRSRKS